MVNDRLVTTLHSLYIRFIIDISAKFHLYTHGIRAGQESGPPPKKKKGKGFLSNTGPCPQKNHKVTKPAFNDGSL